MFKKIFCRVLSAALSAAVIFALVSCDNENGNTDSSEIDSPVSSAPETPTVTDGYPEHQNTIAAPNTGSKTVNFVAAEGGMYRLEKDEWKFSYIKGVVICSFEPSSGRTGQNITYATYMDWFKKISDMNANTVRVKSVMNQAFYEALYNYNAENAKQPLYLLHDIHIDNPEKYNTAAALCDAFKEKTDEVLSAVHGNANEKRSSNNSKARSGDVSSYVAGFIFSADFTPEIISRINSSKADKSYSGSFFVTGEGASIFETALAKSGEYLALSERDTYSRQTPVAFLNKPETDTLMGAETGFSSENIKPGEEFVAGIFAAASVFVQDDSSAYGKAEYGEYVNPSTGKPDRYRAYISALKSKYSVPVIVAETGASTSRVRGAENESEQRFAGLSEDEQGKLLAEMIKSIAKESCAGSVIMSWQDDWTAESYDSFGYISADDDITPDSSSFNQFTGIMSFDAASGYSDGNTIEWMGASPIISDETQEVYAKYDAAYLHIYINVKRDFDFENDTLFVPISIFGRGSKSESENSLTFSDNADFLLVINGKENTRIKTDIHNDVYYWKRSVRDKAVEFDSSLAQKNTGKYGNILYSVNGDTGKSIEAGLLRFGINNPNLSDYDSTADFYCTGKKIEVRIPWALLNVVNPAESMALGDFFKNSRITFTGFDEVKIGVGRTGETINMKPIGFDGLDTVFYRARLKTSYNDVSLAFSSLFKK